MILKITYPVKIGERVVMPGETIDAPDKEARVYLSNEWATEVAEVKIDTGKKHTKVRKSLR